MSLYFRKPEKSRMVRILGSTALLLILVGCNTGVPSDTSGNVSATQTRQTNINPSSAMPQAILTQNPSNTISVGGMLTIAPEGEALDCRKFVLASNQPDYSNNQIQQIAEFFNEHLKNPPEPSTLANVQGGFVGNISSWGEFLFQGCEGYWEVTNITQQPVQLVQINLQLTADPQPDTYQYRLIDTCSLPLPPEDVSCFGSGGGPKAYDYAVMVSQANASKIFPGQLNPTESAPTIDPGKTLEVALGVLPADPSSSFIYTLTPELVLNTSQGNGQVFNLTQWTSTIALVNIRQFSCYQLEGNAFTTTIPQIFNAPVDTSHACLLPVQGP